MFLLFIKLQFLRKNFISEKIEGHSPQHPPASGVQLEGGGWGLPFPFLKIKKGPDFIHLWVNFSIQDIVIRVSRRKNSNFSLWGLFSLVFLANIYQSALIPWNLPYPEKVLVVSLSIIIIVQPPPFYLYSKMF